jgi:hypothetical protein
VFELGAVNWIFRNLVSLGSTASGDATLDEAMVILETAPKQTAKVTEMAA